MNDQTHDDSSFTLDKAITFHRGCAREAIDAEIAGEEVSP